MEYLFQSELRLYFVLPFIAGGELYKIVKKRRVLEESTVKFYAAQLVIGLGKLHERGIIHRDVKLENIMVDSNGYIKIIDFGLAKILDEDEQAMTYCGTLEYFAPEMVRKTGHDKAVDWWALGVMIYEMLFSTSPFFNQNRNVLMNKIKYSQIIFPDKNRFHIEYSPEVVDLINKLLCKEASERIGS